MDTTSCFTCASPSKKTTATPRGMTFEDWDSMLPGASKEEAKKIFDSFASEGALWIVTNHLFHLAGKAL
ncbi:MAG: hypothetical protein M3Y53_05255 [Thermoproteota archaeon]|nr:hypothetical protein [Thermoproteota archaeon]